MHRSCGSEALYRLVQGRIGHYGHFVLSFVGKKWKKEMAVGLEGGWREAYLGCVNLEKKVPMERESDGMWVCDK